MYTQVSYRKFEEVLSSPNDTQKRSLPLLVKLVTNSRAEPLREGDPTSPVAPVDHPPAALSLLSCQLPKSSIFDTLIAVEGTTAAFAGAETLIATSVSHAPPPLPHAFTCSVCEPLAALTEVLIEVP